MVVCEMKEAMAATLPSSGAWAQRDSGPAAYPRWRINRRRPGPRTVPVVRCSPERQRQELGDSLAWPLRPRRKLVKGTAMKVVLFCGGLGMRMRADNQSLPKPMMPIGSRPVLWHIMRYFAHFGHTEFILCLGHGANAVKDYFLDYRETASNDFVLTKGGQHVDMLSTDISDWTITFIDTGMDTAIGERLRRVRPYLEGDEYFLANYGDVLTDAPMNDLVDA